MSAPFLLEAEMESHVQDKDKAGFGSIHIKCHVVSLHKTIHNELNMHLKNLTLIRH